MANPRDIADRTELGSLDVDDRVALPLKGKVIWLEQKSSQMIFMIFTPRMVISSWRRFS
jgi:hypothetical protein